MNKDNNNLRLKPEDGAPDFIHDTDNQNARQTADTQFLHALLTTLLAPFAVNEHKARVSRVIAAITQQQEAEPQVVAHIHDHRVVLWRRATIGLAAILLLGVLTWAVTMPQRTAMAAVTKVIAATETNVARSYEMSHVFNHRGETKTHTSKFYVKGTDLFLFERPTHDGDKILFGRNGKENWFIPPSGPIVVSNDKKYCGPKDSLLPKIPYLNLVSGLDELKSHYNITLLDPEKLTAHTDAQDADIRNPYMKWAKLRGQSKNHHGPQEMIIWYHPTKGYVRRMELSDFSRDERMRPPKPTQASTTNTADTTDANQENSEDKSKREDSDDRRDKYDGRRDRDDDRDKHDGRRDRDDDRDKHDERRDRDDDKDRDKYDGRRDDDKDKHDGRRSRSGRSRGGRPSHFFMRPTALIYDLVDQPALSDSWFSHQTHHAPDRKIMTHDEYRKMKDAQRKEEWKKRREEWDKRKEEWKKKQEENNEQDNKENTETEKVTTPADKE